jgi:hypothetical protein
MLEMIEETTTIKELSASLWMSNQDLVDLAQTGHVLGLHSNSHPTTLAEMPRKHRNRNIRKTSST